MKLYLAEEKFEFDLPKAKTLYKFDERDPLSPNFHDPSMQAVDVVADFKDFQLWVEIKEFLPEEIHVMRNDNDRKTFLLKNLKLKYRDTYLYRYCKCENSIPVKYVCLTNFDDPLNLFFKKQLKKQIPVGKKKGWKHELLSENNLFVVNTAAWNRNFSDVFGTCRKTD